MKTLAKTLPLLSALLWVTAGCGGTSYDVRGEAPARGADARIELADTEAGNRRLSVQVDHLAPPARVDGSSERYSVWLVPRGRDPVLAGTLEYDAGERRGDLETLTPHERFELLVTAERSQTPRRPSGAVVIQQRVGS